MDWAGIQERILIWYLNFISSIYEREVEALLRNQNIAMYSACDLSSSRQVCFCSYLGVAIIHLAFLLQNYDNVLPMFSLFMYPMKTRVGAKLAACDFSNVFSTNWPQFGFIFCERGIVLKLCWNRSWEVKLETTYRDVSAKCLSMRFSSWALQNILEVEGRMMYGQSCWEQSAGCIKEFKIKRGIINEFPLFCLSLPSSRHIFHSQLSTLQHL